MKVEHKEDKVYIINGNKKYILVIDDETDEPQLFKVKRNVSIR